MNAAVKAGIKIARKTLVPVIKRGGKIVYEKIKNGVTIVKPKIVPTAKTVGNKIFTEVKHEVVRTGIVKGIEKIHHAVQNKNHHNKGF